MNDNNKTKQQLIKELTTMRQRVGQLEKSEASRQQSDELLRESENWYQMLVEQSKDAIFLHDFNGKIIDVNQQACDSTGYTREEFLYLFIQDIDKDFLLGKHKGKCMQMVPGEPVNLEGVHTRKDGTTFPVEVRLVIFDSGKRRLMLGLCRDITERKKSQEELLLIKKAVESASDAIGLSDSLGHHFYQNKAFTDLFEYTTEELYAGGAPNIYASGDITAEVITAILGGDSWNGEIEMVSKSGRKFPVLLREDAIKDEKGNIIGFIGLHTDITDRKKMEEELKTIVSNLQKALEEVRTLKGIVPICANCKKIRDDKGFWNQVESYVSKHTEAQFSHGICPECMRKLYPYKKM